MKTSTFSRNGIRFRWAEAGDGVPFIFQHGLGADLVQTFQLLSPLRHTRLIALDCRAHGETETGEESILSFNTFADDVHALAEYLGLRRIIAGGLSMGAGIALNLLLRYPELVAAAALIRPAWSDAPMEARHLYFEVAAHIRRHGAADGRSVFARSAKYRQLSETAPDAARSLLSQFDSPRAEDGLARLERLPADAPSHDRTSWNKVAVPVLVMAHADDPVHTLRCGKEIAAAIPEAHLSEFTPKSTDCARHEQEIRQQVSTFVDMAAAAF